MVAGIDGEGAAIAVGHGLKCIGEARGVVDIREFSFEVGGSAFHSKVEKASFDGDEAAKLPACKRYFFDNSELNRVGRSIDPDVFGNDARPDIGIFTAKGMVRLAGEAMPDRISRGDGLTGVGPRTAGPANWIGHFFSALLS